MSLRGAPEETPDRRPARYGSLRRAEAAAVLVSVSGRAARQKPGIRREDRGTARDLPT